ncbi:MAG: penicillin acylase family protein [Deltaproteobacteria bacterium]|nr:penicillin acylase family protein [Deltaproteobacteria bacterium]
MKWVRRILIVFICLIVTGSILFFCLPLLNNYKKQGKLNIPGLKENVIIQRDANGMAYIHAGNIDDVLMAQGFVTAQDRLFQMQLTRLVVQGRVCEFAGKAAKNLDIRMRTIGLHRLARKQAAMLDNKTKRYFQKYVDGINAFIEYCPDDIPLEFKLADVKPEKWEIADSLDILYYMGYSTAANLNTEITAQMLLETLGYEKTSNIMPLNINADDPDDKGKMQIPSKERLSLSMTGIKNLIPYINDRNLRTGSNNWAISPELSASGSAVLSGDPHLDPRMLPGIFYPTGLITPEIRAVGVNIPGIPGMAIGRTGHIALSATNNYGDMVDLYIETIDPENPDNYLEGKNSIPFTRIKQTLKIKDKNAPAGFRKEEIIIRTTRRGPVVSSVLPGLKTKKVISLRFAPAESMEPAIGMIDILTAKNSKELVKALKHIPMACFNWVFADTSGNIGHQASGRIPIRYNGDGTFPFPVKDSVDNWHGWIPQDEMPAALNPEKKWIGTCNQKTVKNDFPYYYSSFFSPNYRYNRLKQLMALPGRKTVNDMWLYQRDTKNLLAQKISPVLAKILLKYNDTEKMGKILSAWDFRDDPEKAAPAIFQTTYQLFANLVFEDDLGPDKVIVLLKNWYFWQQRLEQMVLQGDSYWFDNIGTPDKKETLEDLFHSAALKAKIFLAPKLGDDPEKWQWGKVHTLELLNPIMRKGTFKTLFGSGPMPMGGSGETLYRGWYDYNKPFEVTHCAALRMVADLGDKEKVLAVLPGGVTGRTFHPHQKDQVDSFMSGKKMYWWVSDKAIDEHAKSRLILNP